LKNQDDLKVNESFYDLERAIQFIGEKKLKYFYYHDLALDYYQKHSPLPLKVLPNKFRTYSHWMIYSKHIPKKLRLIMDQEITIMVNSGVIDLLRARYKP